MQVSLSQADQVDSGQSVDLVALKRDWRMAEASLYSELSNGGSG